MQIKENASRLVKPSTPTPPTLRNHNLSFFDQLHPNTRVPLTLFFSAPSQNHDHTQIRNIYNHLETSLSRTLTEFYPLAGRYTSDDALFIDCSDQGALYVEAVANIPLSEFLHLRWELKVDALPDFFACDVAQKGESDDPLLFIKVTAFECGGVAIGISLSHKCGDMATFCTFLNNWAARTRELIISGDYDHAEEYLRRPIYCSSSYLVPPNTNQRDNVEVSRAFAARVINYPVLRVFTFKGSGIAKLRENMTSVTQKHYSKVQLIVALLLKCFLELDRRNGQPKKDTFVIQPVNLRNKLVPKVPDNYCGNLITGANALIEGDVVTFQSLLNTLRDSINITVYEQAKALRDAEKYYELLSKPLREVKEYTGAKINDVNLYIMNSWSKFSFYDVEFGWGKPVWRSMVNVKIPNSVVLMDDEEGDGLEAWVHLEEKRMSEFEQDPNIHAYMH